MVCVCQFMWYNDDSFLVLDGQQLGSQINKIARPIFLLVLGSESKLPISPVDKPNLNKVESDLDMYA